MTVGAQPERAGLREWVGLAVLALPAVLIAADLTVLHLAVPHLGAALSPSSTQLLWIVDIYGFAVAGLLITMGTLGDRIGRRRLLLIGGAAFAAASVLAAYSTSPELLIGARALLGVTGATLLPSTLSLITNMFRDERQRRFAIAVWSTSFLLGGAMGPLVGGVMLEHFWWGSIFLLAVPIMLVLLVAGPLVLPESREPGTRGVDLASVAMLMAAILSVVYAIKELAAGSPPGLPLVLIVAGVSLGWWFVRRQRRLANPVLDLTLFARRQFSVSLGAQFLSLFALAAIQFLVMQYLQLVLGLSALQAGLWILPAMAAGVAGNLLAPVLARVLSTVGAIVAGLLVGVAGAVVVTQAGGVAGLATAVVGFSMLNFGLNPVLVLAYDLILGSAPPARAGTAAGTAETGNELGIALGVAVAGSIGAAIYRRRVTGDTLPADLPGDVAEAARDTLAGAVAAAERLPAGQAAELLAVVRPAFTDGMQTSAGVLAVLLIAVAVAVGVLLRRASAAGGVPSTGEGAASAGDDAAPAGDDAAPAGDDAAPAGDESGAEQPATAGDERPALVTPPSPASQ